MIESRHDLLNQNSWGWGEAFRGGFQAQLGARTTTLGNEKGEATNANRVQMLYQRQVARSGAH